MSWIVYEDSLRARWDDLVVANDNGRFVHLSGFKRVIENCYHLKPVYAAFSEKGKILGLFPGFLHRSWLFGKKIISQPFSEYGGLLFEPDLSFDKKIAIAQEFLSFIKKILSLSGYPVLEMRHPADIFQLGLHGFQTRRLFKRSWLVIEAPEILWKRLDPKERNVIRKALTYPLRFDTIEDGASLKEKFYPLYLRTMKRLGSPAHPLAYFSQLSHFLKANMKAFVVHSKSTPISGLIAWAVGQSVHITDMVSDERFFYVKPNDLAIWEFLKWAHGEGYKIFDFGPVRYRGQEIFKRKWLLTLDDYYYVYVTEDGLPKRRIKSLFSDNSSLFRYPPLIWKFLVPLPLTSAIGRYFRQQLGL